MKRIQCMLHTERLATLALVGVLIVLQGCTAMTRPRAVPGRSGLRTGSRSIDDAA